MSSAWRGIYSSVNDLLAEEGNIGATGVAPGKVTLTSRLSRVARSGVAPGTPSAPIQRKRQDRRGTAPTRENLTAWTDAAFLGMAPEPAMPRDVDSSLYGRTGVRLEPVQRKGASGSLAGDGQRLGGEPLQPSGNGSRMPQPVQAKMERAFGEDFSAVRIHQSPAAESLEALAYTQGSDISFRPGEYQPQSRRGQELLGHELAHVVQQRQGRVSPSVPLQAKGALVNENESLEREADEMGAKAARGELLGEKRDGDEPGEERAERGDANRRTRRDNAAPSKLREPRPGSEEEKDSRTNVNREPVSDAGSPVNGAREATSERADDAAKRAEPGDKRPLSTRATETAGAEATETAGAETADETASAEATETAGAETADETASTEATETTGASASDGSGEAPVQGAAKVASAPGTASGAGAPAQATLDSPDAILTSLAQAPASQAMSAFARARQASPAALQVQRDQAHDALPVLPAPTGLPAAREQSATRPRSEPGGGGARGGEVVLAPSSSSSKTAPDGAEPVPEAPRAPAATPTVLAGGDQPAPDDQKDGNSPPNDPALARSAKNALGKVNLPAIRIPTKAGPAPSVDTSGDADASQIDTSCAQATRETQKATAEAFQASRQDFGEHDIFPAADDTTLAAQTQLGAAPTLEAQEAAAVQLPPEAMASIDAEASPVLSQRIGAEKASYDQARVKHDADTKAAHEHADQEIAGLQDGARTEQMQARSTAQTEVSAARRDWQAEIDGVDNDFRAKSEAARAEQQGKIRQEESVGNQKAAAHFAEAEAKAAAEKQKAEAEAAAKKKAASKQSKGFWGWVKSKAKALIDGLKSAVNFIYDNLRKAVKAMFDAAKKLALATIELARKAIVGLIKAFGELLKGFLSIALAAFPELRKRFTQAIDTVVNKTVEAVNAVADALKTAVTAVLDFLASTIDKLLGIIQGLYNGLLTVVGMLISGEFAELMKKVGYLIDAAKTAPGQFGTGAYEELLGGDLDKPLSADELVAAGRKPPSVTGAPTGADEMATTQGPVADESIPRAPWTNENVGVDRVLSGIALSPELSSEMMQRVGGGDGTFEFGHSDDVNRSMEALLGTTGHGSASAGGQTPDSAQAVTQDDGLSPSERAQVKWTLMKQGLTRWWDENWPTVLGGGVLGVAGFIVANILTGGAILAALPTIMTVIGALFTGVTAVQLVGHVQDYLTKGWAGDIQGGGKSLAKGLAAGAIEVIMLLTMKAGSAVLKGAKTVAKTTARGAQAVARGTVKAVKGAANLARRGAQWVIKGGKVLLRGVSRGLAKGVKRVRELGARLLRRTKFKGFRVHIKNRRFRLEGKINPWLLLIDGSIEWEKMSKHGGLGNKVKVNGSDGLVIGVKHADRALVDLFQGNRQALDDALALLRRGDVDAKSLIHGLKGMDPNEAQEILSQLRKLKEVDEAALKKTITQYRQKTGIPKDGTVGAGKAEFGHPQVDDVTYKGASTKAQTTDPTKAKHNPRYQHPHHGQRWANQLTNHAEQTVLGDVANKLDDFYKGKIPRSKVVGTVKMAVDRKVCRACRQGFDGGSAGIIKQFSDEFPGVTVIISNPSTTEILVVKAGKLLIKNIR